MKFSLVVLSTKNDEYERKTEQNLVRSYQKFSGRLDPRSFWYKVVFGPLDLTKMTCNVKITNYILLENFDVQWSAWEITICFDTASFLPFEAYFLIFEMKIAISLFAAANGNV